MYIPNAINVLMSLVFSYKSIISERQNPYLDLKGRAKEAKVFKLLFPYAGLIHANSYGIKKEVERFYAVNESKVVHFYNFFDPSVIFEKAKEFPVFDEVDIVWVGRLGKQKGWVHFIHILKKMKDAGCSPKVALIGDGLDRTELESLVEKFGLCNVTLYGHQTNPYPYMQKAKMLVLTSEWESFGNVLVEGMVLGLGIASFDCDYGPSEILNEGLYGELISIDGMEAGIDTLEYGEFLVGARDGVFKVLDDLEKYQSLAVEGSKRFLVDSVGGDVINMIESVN